jgi:histidinol phosphatase-like PHP family hydrolase
MIRTVRPRRASRPILEDDGDFPEPFLDRYVRHILDLKQAHRDSVPVLLGGEIHFPVNQSTLHQLQPFLEDFDYLLFEAVTEESLDDFLKKRARFPFPVGLAHTDPLRCFPRLSPEELIDRLARKDVFFELNTCYIETYQDNRDFYSHVAGSQLRLSLGSDTHQFLGDMRWIEDAIEFVQELGIEENLYPWEDLL